MTRFNVCSALVSRLEATAAEAERDVEAATTAFQHAALLLNNAILLQKQATTAGQGQGQLEAPTKGYIHPGNLT